MSALECRERLESFRMEVASSSFLAPSPCLVQGLSLSEYSVNNPMNELITLFILEELECSKKSSTMKSNKVGLYVLL